MNDTETKEEVAAPKVERQKIPATIQIQSDKIDEVAAYFSAMRTNQMYNTQIPFVIVPNTMKALDLEKMMPIPSRIKASEIFIDHPSFIAYVNRYKPTMQPQIFVQKTDNGLKAKCVFDYHNPGKEVNTTETTGSEQIPVPQWGDHKAYLNLEYSQDYKTLRENSEDWKSQEDFALFVEDNLHLFQTPDGAEMLEMAQDLRGAKNATWRASRRLNNGQSAIEYDENLSAASKSQGVDLIVPNTLVLRCPLFEGFEPETFTAAFRWRLKDGHVFFSYRLMTKLQERVAQDLVLRAIKAETGLDHYLVNQI